MYLLLGDAADPCCANVRAVLESRSLSVNIVANPFLHPSRFTWRLDNKCSVSHLRWDEINLAADKGIDGVLVRNVGWADFDGWEGKNISYIRSEILAALLGWLWSLPCPVVNRYP